MVGRRSSRRGVATARVKAVALCCCCRVRVACDGSISGSPVRTEELCRIEEDANLSSLRAEVCCAAVDLGVRRNNVGALNTIREVRVEVLEW